MIALWRKPSSIACSPQLTPFLLLLTNLCLSSNVPRELEGELIQQYGADVKQVGVSLVDKSSEDYVPPKEVHYLTIISP